MTHVRYVSKVLRRYVAPVRYVSIVFRSYMIHVRYVSILFLPPYDTCALCVYSVLPL